MFYPRVHDAGRERLAFVACRSGFGDIRDLQHHCLIAAVITIFSPLSSTMVSHSNNYDLRIYPNVISLVDVVGSAYVKLKEAAILLQQRHEGI